MGNRGRRTFKNVNGEKLNVKKPLKVSSGLHI